MRLKKLLKDDERFGHKAGDLFIVEDADYDDEKVVGVKIEVKPINNSFYKTELKNGTMADVTRAGEIAFYPSAPAES